MWVSESDSECTQVCLMSTRRLAGGKIGTRHRLGWVIIEIVLNPYRCCGVCVGTDVPLEGAMESLALCSGILSCAWQESLRPVWFLCS